MSSSLTTVAAVSGQMAWSRSVIPHGGPAKGNPMMFSVLAAILIYAVAVPLPGPNCIAMFDRA